MDSSLFFGGVGYVLIGYVKMLEFYILAIRGIAYSIVSKLNNIKNYF